MNGVVCKIWMKSKPTIWVELIVGVDGKNKRWRLLRKSKVSFHKFRLRQGSWDYAHYHGRIKGITILAGPKTEWLTFELLKLPNSFYQTKHCGRALQGRGWFVNPMIFEIVYRIEYPCLVAEGDRMLPWATG